DEITNLSFDADEITSAHTEFRRMTRVQPQWIRMRNFIQPLRVRTASVNLYRQTESRDQDRLVRFETVRMNVTCDVCRNRTFGPAPLGDRFGKEFEFAAWCWEATFDLTINFHADKTASLCVTIRTRKRNDIW